MYIKIPDRAIYQYYYLNLNLIRVSKQFSVFTGNDRRAVMVVVMTGMTLYYRGGNNTSKSSPSIYHSLQEIAVFVPFTRVNRKITFECKTLH